MKTTLLLSLVLSLSLNATCKVDNHNAPKWVCKDFKEYDTKTYYYSVASEKYSKLGMRYTRTIAIANARSNMARELHGVTKGDTTITNAILKNSRINTIWEDDKSQKLYVLLKAPKSLN